MSLWLVGLSVYWFGSFLFLMGSMALCGQQDERLDLIRTVAQKKPWLVLACISISLLFIFAIAPVATPYWIIRCHLQSRRERSYMNFLTRTHREFIFEPVHPVNLPRGTRTYFESGSAELLEAGFTKLGDYRMKEHPANYFGRCFLSEDGVVVCTLIDIFDEQNFGYSTLFSDGRMLETSSTQCSESMEWTRDNDRYAAVYATGRSIEEGWRMHKEAVAALCVREGVRPLAIEPEAVCDFIRYEGRLFSQILFEQGELDEPPPEPELPPHRVLHKDSRGGTRAALDLLGAGAASTMSPALR
jgi:hypothetical protein